MTEPPVFRLTCPVQAISCLSSGSARKCGHSYRGWIVPRGHARRRPFHAMRARAALYAVPALPAQDAAALVFEMTWKLISLTRIALPLWAAHRIDAAVGARRVRC